MQTSTPTLRSTRVPTRSFQLRRIHELARAAGLDTREGKREQYEAFLLRTINRTSTRQASRSERERVIDELKRMSNAAYRIANAQPVEFVSDADCAGIL